MRRSRRRYRRQGTRRSEGGRRERGACATGARVARMQAKMQAAASTRAAVGVAIGVSGRARCNGPTAGARQRGTKIGRPVGLCRGGACAGEVWGSSSSSSSSRSTSGVGTQKISGWGVCGPVPDAQDFKSKQCYIRSCITSTK